MLRRGGQPSSSSLNPQDPATPTSAGAPQSFHLFPRSTSPGITTFFSKPSKWFNRMPSNGRQVPPGAEPRASTSSTTRKPKISHPTDPRPILSTLKSEPYISGASRSVLDLSLQRTETSFDASRAFSNPGSPVSPLFTGGGGLGDLRNYARKGWSRSADDLGKFSSTQDPDIHVKVEQYRNRSASNSSTVPPSLYSQHPFPSANVTPLSSSPPQSLLSSPPMPTSLSPGVPGHVHTRSQSFTPRLPSKLAAPKLALSPSGPSRKGSASSEREIEAALNQKDTTREKDRYSPASQGRGAFPFFGGQAASSKTNLNPQPTASAPTTVLAPPAIIEPEQEQEDKDRSKRMSQIIHHSAFVNYHSDFSLADYNNGTLNLNKGWKPYKLVLKGTKLYFYKPPGDRAAAVRELFPISLVPALEEALDIDELESVAKESPEVVRDTRKKRAFWGRRAHPELVCEGNTVTRGSLEALVHEAVFGTTTLGTLEGATESPEDLQEAVAHETTSYHDFASTVLLCLPSLAGRAKVESELVRCCSYLVSGASDDTKEELRGRVVWIAGEYLRYHGAPVSPESWEEFRKETIPDFPSDAAFVGELGSLPSSTSMQGLYVPSPRPEVTSFGIGEFSPSLGVFSPRPGQGDKLVSLLDALNLRDPPPSKSPPARRERLDSGTSSSASGVLWAALEREGLTRDNFLKLDPHLVALSLSVYHRSALEHGPVNITFAECINADDNKTDPTTSPFDVFFGSEEHLHWLTKLILNQILAADRSSRMYQTQPPISTAVSPGGRHSEERNAQTSRTHSRSEVISSWVRIAELCRLSGDECSWQAIKAALCARPVARLEKAWKRVDPQAVAAVEGWVYDASEGSCVKEPRTTPWGGDVRETLKERLGKASVPEKEGEWEVSPLRVIKNGYEQLRSSFSLCFRRSELTETSDREVERLKDMWHDYSFDTSAKFNRMDQFMSLSLAAEPRRKGLFEPHFWSRSPPSAPQTSHPLMPLLLVEPLPTVTFIDRNQLLRNRVDSGPTSLVIEDDQFALLMRSDGRVGRRGSDRVVSRGLNNLGGRDLGGTVIPIFEGELILVVQQWNSESRAPSPSPSSRTPSRPPSDAELGPSSPEKQTVSRAPSIRVKPGASQGLDRKPSVARRNSLPAISQRATHVVAEPSSDRPLRVTVKAGTLDRLVHILVHGLRGISVSVADDNGEMPLKEGRTRELRVDRMEFANLWWNAFRSFVTPLVFFELLAKRYLAAQSKSSSESLAPYIRTLEMRLAVVDAIREWLEVGGGAQDCLDDAQLFSSVRTFLRRDDLSALDDSAADEITARQAWENLEAGLKGLRQLFFAQTQRPKTTTVPSGEVNIKSSRFDYGRDAPDVDKISAEDMVGNIDAMAAAVFSNVTEEDFFVAADLMEVQMADKTAWFLPPQFSQSTEEVDIHTIYSHILNCEPSPLIAELTHDALYRLLPPSIRSCIRAFTILHKWLVSKLVAPKVGLRVRQARMDLYLRALEVCRLRSIDTSSTPCGNVAGLPCVRSFVEASLLSAILSVESRLHHTSWYNVAAARGCTCESLFAFLSKPQVQAIHDSESLTVDMGWVLERMLEVMSVPDTLSSMENEGQTLVNAEKRRYLRSIIVNTVSEIGPRRSRRRREVDRRDFERLNNIEREVNHVDFDYRAIKEEAYRESMQANGGLAGPRKGYRPFHKHVVAQQEKNKRDKYLRERLSREKRLEQQRMDRREDYLNKAMHPRRPLTAGQKQQHRNKKSMSTAFFQFMRPISSAFISETTPSGRIKRTPEELDFVPGNKPSFTLSAADAGIAPFINNERSYLFRLDTEDGGHYLLQALNRQDLKKWIDIITRVSKTAAQRRLTYLGPSPQSDLSDHISSGPSSQSRDPRAVFGVDLEVLLHRDTAGNENGSISVPVFIERCLSEIENRGLTESGIYRVAGASSDIQMLKNAINKGEWPITPSTDIYAVCDLIKHWLRDLPRPVLPASSYFEILAAAKLDDLDAKLIRLRDIVQSLPPANFDLLKRMAEHLDRVTDYEDQNHMTAKNLAIVFSPSLLRAPDGNFVAFVSNLGYLHDFVKALIGHFHVIFDEGHEAEADPDDEDEDEDEDEFDEPILEEDEDEDEEATTPSQSPSESPEPVVTSTDLPAAAAPLVVHHDEPDTPHGLS